MKYKKPNEDALGGQGYQYLVPMDPEKMKDGYYELQLLSFGLTKEEDKFAAEYKILETDLRMRGNGSVVLNPSQRHAETYFWLCIVDMKLALSGKETTPKLRKKRSAKYYDTVIEDPKHADEFIISLFEPLIGNFCRLDLATYENKEQRTGLRQTWSPSEGPTTDE